VDVSGASDRVHFWTYLHVVQVINEEAFKLKRFSSLNLIFLTTIAFRLKMF
jgi:hypothetical protein